MVRSVKGLLLAVGLVAPSHAVPEVSQPVLPMRRLRGPKHELGNNRTNVTLRSGDDWFGRVVEAIKGQGVLLKMLGNQDALQKLFDTGTWNWDAQITDGGYQHGLFNDCVNKDFTIKDCSAWAFIRQNFVPMVYNWPDSFHQIGIMVDLSMPEVRDEVTRMHVVDGDTAERYQSGIAIDDLQNWENNLGPDPECLDMLHDGVDYRCYLGNRDSWCGKDLDPKRLIAPVGDGSRWADLFMFDSGADHFNLNLRQCPFAGGSDEDWEAFQLALDSFYTGASSAVWPDGNLLDLDERLYLETEVNMEAPANELMNTFKSKDAILAVVVQTNLCRDQLGDSNADKWCPSDDDDIATIKQAIDVACQLASGGALPGVNVLAGSFPTNALPDRAQDGEQSCWNWYRGKSKEGGQYQDAARPDQYLEPIDCDADYDERYSKLSRKGCTDNA